MSFKELTKYRMQLLKVLSEKSFRLTFTFLQWKPCRTRSI